MWVCKSCLVAICFPHAPVLCPSVLDDSEFYEKEEPFKLSDLVELCHLLNHISFNLIWKVQCVWAGCSAWGLLAAVAAVCSFHDMMLHASLHLLQAPKSELRDDVLFDCLLLLSVLYDRDTRQPFCPDKFWLIK